MPNGGDFADVRTGSFSMMEVASESTRCAATPARSLASSSQVRPEHAIAMQMTTASSFKSTLISFFSTRSQTAFHETLGIGPVAFVRYRRLCSIHSTLRRSNAEQTTVADVALQHGFLNLGRFSGYYRSLFGEYPAQTLAY